MSTPYRENPEVSTYAPSRTPSPGAETRVEDAKFILLFGCTGTGKTSFANIASGGQMEVGNGLRSSTKYLEASSVFRVDDQSVVIVDCPGFNDTYLTETEILRRISEFLTRAYNLKYKVVGFLYVYKISETRVGGTSFRHMNMFKALCGTPALKNVVYVTNMWSEPPTEDEILRETELRDTNEFFGGALAEGAQMARHNNTHDSAQNIIRMLLGKTTVVTKLQIQLVDHGIPLEETDIGLVIGHDLEDNLRKQKDEMEELMAQKQKALEANDQNWLQRLKSQEERTRSIEQQLVDQLQSLQEMKARQSTNAPESSRVHENKSEAIVDSGLSSFQTQMKAIEDELARKAQVHDSQLATYTPRQQEWDRKREEEDARKIAQIRDMTARTSQYTRTPDGRNTSGASVLGFVAGVGSAALEASARLIGLNRGVPVESVQGSSHAQTYSPASRDPSIENRRPSHESSRTYPTETQDSPNAGYGYEESTGVLQEHRQDGHNITQNKDRSYTSTSERQRQR